MFHDRQVDAAFLLGEGCLDDTLVELFDFTVFENAGQVFVSGFVFCEDYDSGGVPVEPVNDKNIPVAFS